MVASLLPAEKRETLKPALPCSAKTSFNPRPPATRSRPSQAEIVHDAPPIIHGRLAVGVVDELTAGVGELQEGRVGLIWGGSE